MSEQISSFYDENDSLLLSFYQTNDGSLSVKLKKNDIESELMHSNEGAFSETIYVYLPVIQFVFDNKLNPIFLSIGLGMGYIEIMIVSFFLKHNPDILKNNFFCIQTFEKENILIEQFKKFFLAEDIPNDFKYCYEKIIKYNCDYFQIKEDILKAEMISLILNNNILFYNEFSDNSKLKYSSHGIFFDAFSVKSSPFLWKENVLHHVFNDENCDKICSFATYASKTVLKKILRENNFILENKKGFLRKRECILAERY